MFISSKVIPAHSTFIGALAPLYVVVNICVIVHAVRLGCILSNSKGSEYRVSKKSNRRKKFGQQKACYGMITDYDNWVHFLH